MDWDFSFDTHIAINYDILFASTCHKMASYDILWHIAWCGTQNIINHGNMVIKRTVSVHIIDVAWLGVNILQIYPMNIRKGFPNYDGFWKSWLIWRDLLWVTYKFGGKFIYYTRDCAPPSSRCRVYFSPPYTENKRYFTTRIIYNVYQSLSNF